MDDPNKERMWITTASGLTMCFHDITTAASNPFCYHYDREKYYKRDWTLPQTLCHCDHFTLDQETTCPCITYPCGLNLLVGVQGTYQLCLNVHCKLRDRKFLHDIVFIQIFIRCLYWIPMHSQLYMGSPGDWTRAWGLTFQCCVNPNLCKTL